MKILICITHVPDTTSKIQFTADKTQLDKSGVQFIIGPYDDYALARGVELRDQSGGTLTVLNVGEADTEPTLRKALAIGADDAVKAFLCFDKALHQPGCPDVTLRGATTEPGVERSA